MSGRRSINIFAKLRTQNSNLQMGDGKDDEVKFSPKVVEFCTGAMASAEFFQITDAIHRPDFTLLDKSHLAPAAQPNSRAAYPADANDDDKAEFECECYHYVMENQYGLPGVATLHHLGLSLEPQRRAFVAETIAETGQEAIRIDGDEGHRVRTVFSMAYERYALGDPSALDILRFIAVRCNTHYIFAQIRANKSHWNIEDFESVCDHLVAGADNPVSIALIVAHMCGKRAKKFLSLQEEYERLRDKFTNSAMKILDAIDSDFLATVYLEHADELGVSAIEYAISKHNAKFLSSPRVASVVDAMWSSSQYMVNDEPSTATNLLRRRPLELFLLPWVRYLFRALDYLAFVCMIIGFTYVSGSSGGSVAYPRFSTLVVCVYLANELFTIFESVKKTYAQTSFNTLAVPNYALNLFLVLYILLISQELGFSYLIAWMPVILLYRLWLTLRVFHRFSVLNFIFRRILEEMASLVVVLFTLWLVFTLAFHLILYQAALSSGITYYEQFLDIAVQLAIAWLGNVNPGAFSGLPTDQQLICQYLLLLYTYLAMVVIVNTLIALMANIFNDSYEVGVEGYYLTKSQMAWEYGKHHAGSISILNVPAHLIAALLVLAGCGRGGDSWTCPHCHKRNNGDGRNAWTTFQNREHEFELSDANKGDLAYLQYALRVLYATPEKCRNLCEQCLRVDGKSRLMVSRYRRVREKVSAWVCMVVVYPFVLAGVGVWACLSRCCVGTCADPKARSHAQLRHLKELDGGPRHVRFAALEKEFAKYVFHELNASNLQLDDVAKKIETEISHVENAGAPDAAQSDPMAASGPAGALAVVHEEEKKM